MIMIALFFSGYQPVLAIPPIQKSIVKADFSQDQQIQPGTLSEAFTLPHPGYLTTTYSVWHPGVDIAIGLGMPIHPILKGKITDVKYGFFGYGNQVTVEHELGYKSTYSHMGKIFAKSGDLVTKESILGQVGLTGRTTGPHTHLEIMKDNKYINPANILPNIPDFPTYAKQIQVNTQKTS
jgi:murein DD-endopeptidase MepM/ murein hydrolase activator NlpD